MKNLFWVRAWASVAVFAAAHVLAADAPAKAGKPPNIVILLADDLGYADVGFQGGKDVPTPHVNSLAAHGVRFTSGYVSGTYCSPSRAGLATGRYQTRFGHEFNGGATAGLPLSETTLADRLKAAGYATGAVGKWHLGSAPQYHPQKRGFDEYFGFLGAAHSYFVGQTNANAAGAAAALFGNQRPDLQKDAVAAIGREIAAPIYRGQKMVPESEYLTDAFAREAVAFIDRHKEHPFFLYLAFNAVHTPMQATDNRLKRFESIADKTRQTYAAMLFALDEAVGQVLQKLRATGLEDNTLIFFFSDNGGPAMPSTTINGSRNDPLRGSKRTTLEGGIRVPFAIQWKGKLPAGKVYQRPIIQLDVLPTALAAAGVDASPQWKLDGVNLLPYLEGTAQGDPHDKLFWRFGPQWAIRKGDWKLVQYDSNADESTPETRAASVSGRPILTKPRLYNVADDPGETRDFAAAQPEKVKQLNAAWQKWNTGLVPPLWGPSPIPLPTSAPPRANNRLRPPAGLAAEQYSVLVRDGYRLSDILIPLGDIEE